MLAVVVPGLRDGDRTRDRRCNRGPARIRAGRDAAAIRRESKPQIEAAIAAGTILVCDRYLASSVAYGEALGLDPAWLTEIQRHLPQPALTILLDIAPATAARRKSANRDRYERDLALLGRVRESYRRQATQPQWLRL